MSDIFEIQGAGGKRTLKGEIAVCGAKNSALKIFPAVLLFQDALRIKNVPEIGDIQQMKALLEAIGVSVSQAPGSYELFLTEKQNSKFPEHIAKRLRASIVAIGPALARFGKVSFPHPGGCLIGARPIDMFLQAFQDMGATLKKKNETEYMLVAPRGGLRGASIFFKNQSVTGTETIMMAACLARGVTTISNAAMEPEIEILADFLNTCGAKITGAGTSTITIRGGGLLKSRKKIFTVPPDRIEAGSFLILSALAGSDVRITKCNPNELKALIETLRASGVRVEVGKDSVRVREKRKSVAFRAVDVKTHEYPGFPTDLQAPMTVFLTQTEGRAMVFETIFEGRFRYVEELRQMGADIDECDPHRIIIRGPSKLHGKELKSPDLRAGLAYIIAGAVANGKSVIHTVENIDRGHERLPERLSAIGVRIRRLSLG